MARILQSRDLYALLQSSTLTPDQIHQAYNALDSAVTLRVHEALAPRLAACPHAQTSYSFTRAMQAPAFDMMRRGVAINSRVRADETERYLAIKSRAQTLLDLFADAVWGPEEYVSTTSTKELFTPIGKRGQPLAPRTRTVKTSTTLSRPRGLNATSDKQCLAFFNVALKLDVVHEIRKTPQGSVRTPTANGKALRKWAGKKSKGPGVSPRDRSIPPVHFAAPFVSLILTIRDADKMLQVLRTPLDPDGRARCSYNVVGTESGRWSSSKNVYGRGTNLQNITPSMRRMFCADDGFYFISTDLEQAESRLVAGLVWQATGSSTYLDACLSGDLHTTVARMTWPELGWSDDPKANRKIANLPYPLFPRFSYRDISKRLGHGSNYAGSAYGISLQVGVPLPIVEDFQMRYFTAFPALLEWHKTIITQVQTDQFLDTPLHRRRWLFARPTESSTHREAIAFIPQSTIAELLNLIMFKVWARSRLHPSHPDFLPISLLLQNHDAFAFQVPTSADLPAIISAVNDEFQTTPVPFVRGDERKALIIPGEFVTGFNWAYKDTHPDKKTWTFKDGNPDGLVKWSGAETRKRTTPAVALAGDFLGRPFSRGF